ncbi:SpoIIE family protein phosphatase [Streptomyces sp. NPDC051563]|uniref:SpoIIE family protein phosphatase n=1 Tax=Streptomyces sp. NPDC051563 TaxID=3365659 RepID=UPI00378BFDDA
MSDFLPQLGGRGDHPQPPGMGPVRRRVHRRDGRGPRRLALVATAYVSLAAAYAARSRRKTESRLLDVEEVAKTLEDVLFVPLPSVIGPVRLGASYASVSRATRVGGDLYEAVSPPYGVRLVIADVQGKGLQTVRCAAVVPAAFREAGHEIEGLADVGLRIEAALDRRTDGRRFVTGILAQIGPAGHLLMRPATVKGGSIP